mmetsp:Transcript_25428/g.65431  ORF Transcript_25428/g.65431 Transcript_25428/m.65431 type:complete len:240 (-) Transcript_25428:55-774(-)
MVITQLTTASRAQLAKSSRWLWPNRKALRSLGSLLYTTMRKTVQTRGKLTADSNAYRQRVGSPKCVSIRNISAKNVTRVSEKRSSPLFQTLVASSPKIIGENERSRTRMRVWRLVNVVANATSKNCGLHASTRSILQCHRVGPQVHQNMTKISIATKPSWEKTQELYSSAEQALGPLGNRMKLLKTANTNISRNKEGAEHIVLAKVCSKYCCSSSGHAKDKNSPLERLPGSSTSRSRGR